MLGEKLYYAAWTLLCLGGERTDRPGTEQGDWYALTESVLGWIYKLYERLSQSAHYIILELISDVESWKAELVI